VCSSDLGLRLTLGGRYTHDERDVELRSRRGTGACRLVDETNTALDPCERNLSASFDVPTWNVSLDYRINDDAMVYVAHRHGYRAGGFNIRATSPLQSIAFDPEEVDDIEVGAKLSGSVGGIGYHWNLAAYQMWYKDIQRTVAQVFNGVLVAGVFNNADAEIGGFETDFSIDLTDELFLTGSWAYVDAVHTRFDSGGMSLDDIGFGQAEHNITGAVTWSPYESERWGAVSGTLSFTSRSPWFSQQALPAFEPEARVGWQQLTNLSIDWDEVAGSRVSVNLFVRNLFDQDHVQSQLSIAGSFGFVNRLYGEPRVYGVRMSYAFGNE